MSLHAKHVKTRRLIAPLPNGLILLFCPSSPTILPVHLHRPFLCPPPPPPTLRPTLPLVHLLSKQLFISIIEQNKISKKGGAGRATVELMFIYPAYSKFDDPATTHLSVEDKFYLIIWLLHCSPYLRRNVANFCQHLINSVIVLLPSLFETLLLAHTTPLLYIY